MKLHSRSEGINDEIFAAAYCVQKLRPGDYIFVDVMKCAHRTTLKEMMALLYPPPPANRAGHMEQLGD